MIHDIEFTPNGNYIAGGFRDGIVRFWDTETHELEETIEFDNIGGNYNLTFTPDGEIMAASDPDLGGEIYLFDMENFSQIDMIEPEGRVTSMEFSPDGTKLAYGLTDGGVEILDTKDWSIIYSFKHGNSRVRGLSFGPDSRNLAIGSGDGNLFVYGYK